MTRMMASKAVTALIPLMLVLYAGCRSGPHPVGQTTYKPRGGEGIGYSEMRTDQRTFEVTFVAVTPQDAHDGVMRRAADLTLANGFDDFIVVRNEDHDEQAIRRRFLVAHVRRRLAGTTLTIQMLKTGD